MTEIVTNGNPEKRVRLRCQATTKAGVQCRSTAVSEADGLCSVHGGRLNPVELGRKGGKARKRKGRDESWSTKVARWFDRAGDHDVDRIMSTPQGAAAAMRLAEAELERRQAEAERPGPVVGELFKPIDWSNMADLFRRTEQLHHLASYPRAIAEPVLAHLTPSELEVVLAEMSRVAGEGEAPEEHGTAASSESSVPYYRASPVEQDPRNRKSMLSQLRVRPPRNLNHRRRRTRSCLGSARREAPRHRLRRG